MVYQWKIGSFHKTDPQVAGEVLHGMAEAGNLNAKALVDASRPEDAPLHSEFEWDDKKAAEDWRIHQGRNLINALVIMPENETAEAKEPIRAFLSVKAIDSDNYTRTTEILLTQDGKDKMIKQALRELIAFQRKYRNELKWAKAADGKSADEAIQMSLEILEGSVNEQSGFPATTGDPVFAQRSEMLHNRVSARA